MIVAAIRGLTIDKRLDVYERCKPDEKVDLFWGERVQSQSCYTVERTISQPKSPQLIDDSVDASVALAHT